MKRLIYLLACLTFALLGHALDGDIDGDGKLTSADYKQLAKLLSDGDTWNSDWDYNGDEEVGIGDLTKLICMVNAASGFNVDIDGWEDGEDWDGILNSPRRVASASDFTLSSTEVILAAGEKRAIALQLDNPIAVIGLMLTLNLPPDLEYVSCSVDRGKYNKVEGSEAIVMYSAANTPLIGNSGSVLNVVVKANKAGTYKLGAKGVQISDENFSTIKLRDLAIGPIGDANGDGLVSVIDAVATVDYILNNNPSDFVFDNADVDGSGVISISDVEGIANIILNK